MEFKIYAACLAAYNNGILHGAWIDCLDGENEVMEQIQAMLKASPEPDAEEWAIHDCDFEGYPVSEGESIAKLCDIAERANKLERDCSPMGKLFMKLVSEYGPDYAEQIIEEGYMGTAENDEAWVSQFLDDMGYFRDIPQQIADYFDFRAFYRDMELNGEVDRFTIDGDYHYVRTNV